MFFKAKPNISDGEKARLEFHLQQINDVLGAERCRLPVVSSSELVGWSDQGKNPDALIVKVGDHLRFDTQGLTLTVLPVADSDSGCGSCGGGSCSGMKSLPGKYDLESRTVTVTVDPTVEPFAATALIINAAVCDLLCKNAEIYQHFPEWVDLATIAVGLGSVRSNLQLVASSSLFWDITHWQAAPRPFLGYPGLAYSNAVAAWMRNETSPSWAAELQSEVRAPMKKSLKFLHQTNDCFLKPKDHSHSLNRSPEGWWHLLKEGTTAEQIIALRHIPTDRKPTAEQESLLVEKLQSAKPALVMHAISTVEQFDPTDATTIAFRELVTDRTPEIQSKAVLALTRQKQLDDRSLYAATDLVESGARHSVFAGIVALRSLAELSDPQLEAADRAFMRALSACDYEFIGLLVEAYQTWTPDAEAHFKESLAHHTDLLSIALDSLRGVPSDLTSIDKVA